jgi:hypothetical protein
MKIRKRYLLLGIILCMMFGPAGVAAIIALIKLTSVPSEALAQGDQQGGPDPVD